MSHLRPILAFTAALASLFVAARAAEPLTGISDQPCPAPSPAQDWPGLCKYRAANAEVLASSTPTRIVFIGDSITEGWVGADPALFERGVVNRGIGGQTTPQMLVRFRADVVALHPQVVHVLAGTNDIAGNTGPSSLADYRNNIMSMVEIAQANGIDVILGSIPPAATFPWRQQIEPLPRIAEMNAWLRDYAKQKKLRFIDYHSALAGPAGELRADLGNDGVHPNSKGYAVMRKLIEPQLPR
ncbi:MAG TPA: SGNH/GDSL hydrolase family protein [Steroidobacteraceae bacterium]|nr:SGNH/GDSL hydrolase family protein [Steroidobacteraceae bacterium]